MIKISQAQRNKKKFVTIVSGLGSYGKGSICGTYSSLAC